MYTARLEHQVWGREAPIKFVTGLFTLASVNRREATGGSAKEIPRNSAALGVASSMKPWTVPIVVFILKGLMDMPSSTPDELTSKDRRLLHPPSLRK